MKRELEYEKRKKEKADLKEVEENQNDRLLGMILDFYSNVGEILYYEKESKDKDGLIVTKPRAMVNTLIESLIDHRRILDMQKILDSMNNDNLHDNTAQMKKLEDMKYLLSKGFFKKDWFLDVKDRANDEVLGEKEVDAESYNVYWNLLQRVGIGTVLNPDVMFIPLFIGDRNKTLLLRKIHENQKKLNASSKIVRIDDNLPTFIPTPIEELAAVNTPLLTIPEFSNKFTATYEFKNTKGNGIRIFQQLAAEVAKKCKIEICYSKKLEDRKRNCFVSTITGSTGLFRNVEKDGDYCLNCIHDIKGQKIFCSICKTARLCVRCSHGYRTCLNCCTSSQFNSHPNEARFIISQYQNCEGIQCRDFVEVMVFGLLQSEVLEAVNALDQILEDASKSQGGYVERKEDGCFQCNHERLETQLDTDSVNSALSCRHDRRKEKRLLKLVKRAGNFVNFQELVLQENEDSKEFLEGALKITRSFYKKEFRFRGRLSRYEDFNEIAEYFKESMV